jgi:hypothetical protein
MMLMDENAAPFTVEVDKRVEKDLRGVPKHIIGKFLDSLDERSRRTR